MLCQWREETHEKDKMRTTIILDNNVEDVVKR